MQVAHRVAFGHVGRDVSIDLERVARLVAAYEAIGYAIKQRAALRIFLTDSKLPLDNNYAERGLRIFALGRKNFLFAGHLEGAQNLAVLQSIVSTRRLHGVNPYEYIKDLLIRMQTHPVARVDELMPWNWAPAIADAQA